MATYLNKSIAWLIILCCSIFGSKGAVYAEDLDGSAKQVPTFGPGNEDAIFVDLRGYVGIGTTKPSERLDVHGSVEFSQDNGKLVLRTPRRNHPGRYRLVFENNSMGIFEGDGSQGMSFNFMTNFAKNRSHDTQLKVFGSATSSWGTYLGLSHDGADGLITTDVGNLQLAPAKNVAIGTSMADEKLVVQGNIKLVGQSAIIFPDGSRQTSASSNTAGTVGAFPSPSYDSGWVELPMNQIQRLSHNLGGNPDNYMVDLQLRGPVYGRHTRGIGGRQADIGNNQKDGAYWQRLDDDSIEVIRESANIDATQARIRIWVYN